MTLKVKKSTGYDDLSNDLLKQIIDEILIPLEHVMNFSIHNGIVPEKNENRQSHSYL